jgi:opacity protein-like surface antigen
MVLLPAQKNSGGLSMKKILLLTVIAVFLMVPVAFAKTMISDSELAAVTAQDGVNIAFSGVTVSDVSIDCSSWGDTDGFTDYLGAGYVGAAIEMEGDLVTLPDNQSLSIEVGTNASNVTAVKIGLPQITIGAVNMTNTLKLAEDKTLTTTPQTLGVAYMGGLTATVGGGSVIITAIP